MDPTEVSPEVVCDAGPILHLDELGALDLLADFSKLSIFFYARRPSREPRTWPIRAALGRLGLRACRDRKIYQFAQGLRRSRTIKIDFLAGPLGAYDDAKFVKTDARSSKQSYRAALTTTDASFQADNFVSRVPTFCRTFDNGHDTTLVLPAFSTRHEACTALGWRHDMRGPMPSMMRSCFVFSPFVIALLLAWRLGNEMPVRAWAAMAITLGTVVHYVTRAPDASNSFSSQIPVAVTMAQFWYVITAAIGSANIFVATFESPDGTTFRCANPASSIVITWSYACFFSLLAALWERPADVQERFLSISPRR